jgi:peptidoglycan/LPS O-acetylase OafA/YrhL
MGSREEAHDDEIRKVHKIRLSNFTPGRDNNFHLIRIVAALAVVITHSFALAIGTGEAEPFRKSLGMTMGSIAVDVFFITSGFLVTASLLTRQSAIEFIWARFLRIFPALLIMLLLTVFGLGVFFTSLPIQSYLSDSRTYFYLVKCATLITGVSDTLPGVFHANPYKNSINGSLWSMPYEVRMYAILAIIWVTLRIKKRTRLRAFEMAIVTGAVIAGVLVVARYFFYLPGDDTFVRLFFMFFSGAAFYVLKDYITLSYLFFWLFSIALLSSAIANKHAFFVVYTLTIAYVLFYIAYIPSGFIRKYNLVGDYSYGVYIYAFPVQQTVAALVPGVSVFPMLLISTSATLLLGALSWHLLERHALGLKALYVDYTKKILALAE